MTTRWEPYRCGTAARKVGGTRRHRNRSVHPDGAGYFFVFLNKNVVGIHLDRPVASRSEPPVVRGTRGSDGAGGRQGHMQTPIALFSAARGHTGHGEGNLGSRHGGRSGTAKKTETSLTLENAEGKGVIGVQTCPSRLPCRPFSFNYLYAPPSHAEGRRRFRSCKQNEEPFWAPGPQFCC